MKISRDSTFKKFQNVQGFVDQKDMIFYNDKFVWIKVIYLK